MDEMPVFTVKAKDKLAIRTLIAYERLCVEHGLMEQADEVRKARQEFTAWQGRNPDRMKLPDHQHEYVTGGCRRCGGSGRINYSSGNVVYMNAVTCPECREN